MVRTLSYEAPSPRLYGCKTGPEQQERRGFRNGTAGGALDLDVVDIVGARRSEVHDDSQRVDGSAGAQADNRIEAGHGWKRPALSEQNGIAQPSLDHVRRRANSVRVPEIHTQEIEDARTLTGHVDTSAGRTRKNVRNRIPKGVRFDPSAREDIDVEAHLGVSGKGSTIRAAQTAERDGRSLGPPNSDHQSQHAYQRQPLRGSADEPSCVASNYGGSP